MKFVFGLLLTIGILGCDTDASKGRGSPQAPVTFYGKTIKNTKDFSKDISKKNDDFKKQTDQLSE